MIKLVAALPRSRRLVYAQQGRDFEAHATNWSTKHLAILQASLPAIKEKEYQREIIPLFAL